MPEPVRLRLEQLRFPTGADGLTIKGTIFLKKRPFSGKVPASMERLARKDPHTCIFGSKNQMAGSYGPSRFRKLANFINPRALLTSYQARQCKHLCRNIRSPAATDGTLRHDVEQGPFPGVQLAREAVAADSQIHGHMSHLLC